VGEIRSVILHVMSGISSPDFTYSSRDPEGTRKEKAAKLTPLGSQDESYLRELTNRDVEMEIFDTNLGKVPDSIPETDGTEVIMIDSDEEVTETNIPAPPITTNTIVVPAKETHIPDTSDTQPAKRRAQKSKDISLADRDESRCELLMALLPLNPPADKPDLLRRSAERFESNLYERVFKTRSVNALGRSSTLLTAGKPRDLLSKYLKEKEALLTKVTTYVETTTKEGVDIDQVQSGEIWEVIRGVIDSVIS
jgi:hypothetical protein